MGARTYIPVLIILPFACGDPASYRPRTFRSQGFEDFRPSQEAAGNELYHVPRLIQTSKPEYPTKLYAREIEGFVVVGYTVSATGLIHDVQVLHSDPPGIFDQSAVDAAYRWVFEPAVSNGNAIAFRKASLISFCVSGTDHGRKRPKVCSGRRGQRQVVDWMAEEFDAYTDPAPIPPSEESAAGAEPSVE